MTGQPRPAISRVITKEDMLERLELEILSGKTPAGARLPSERQLAERFAVSRPVIREVLRTLGERGLIESAPGRGTFVRDIDKPQAAPMDSIYRRRKPTPRDLVEARMMLERQAALLAAARATDDERTAMSEALTEFAASPDVVARARADIAFHRAIARASHNPVIETMFASIATLTFELMLRSLGDQDVSNEAVPYHQEILDCIQRRDGEAAEEAMARHLGVALKHYGRDLDRSLELVTQRKMRQLLEPDNE